MTKRWKIKEPAPAEIVERLTKEVKVSPVIANLLYHRGITNYDEAKLFFRPQLEQLHDPFLMKDMDKAIVRIERAIKDGEKILVYGDYDVDGTTAVALVFSFFSSQILPFDYAQGDRQSERSRGLKSQISYYIPDRYKEGYGISTAGIDFAKENNFSLIIALDCGIKAIDKVAYANEKGIDFIICDHHLP